VIDLESLRVLKKIDIGARACSSPRLIGDRVIVGTNGGQVLLRLWKSRALLQLPDTVTKAIAATDDGRCIYSAT
jgi:hypothetical protein